VRIMSRKTSHQRRANHRFSPPQAARFIPRPLRQPARVGGLRTVGSLTNTVLADTMSLGRGQLLPKRRQKNASYNLSNTPRRLRPGSISQLQFPNIGLSLLQNPAQQDRALGCARRRERREVLFARGRTGLAGVRYSGRRPPSKQRC